MKITYTDEMTYMANFYKKYFIGELVQKFIDDTHIIEEDKHLS